MSDLSHLSPGDAAKDILVGAGVTYYLGKATSGDPHHVDQAASEGRILPTVKVRNTAEYAAVATGQIGIANFVIWPILCVIWGVTLFIASVPPMLLSRSSNGAGIVGLIVCWGAWGYLVMWKLNKKILRMLPTISYADGYQGPLGVGRHSPQPGPWQPGQSPPIDVSSRQIPRRTAGREFPRHQQDRLFP